MVTSLILIFAFLFSGTLVDMLIQAGKRTDGMLWTSIDPGPIVWLPAVMSFLLAAAYRRLAERPRTDLAHEGFVLSVS